MSTYPLNECDDWEIIDTPVLTNQDYELISIPKVDPVPTFADLVKTRPVFTGKSRSSNCDPRRKRRKITPFEDDEVCSAPRKDSKYSDYFDNPPLKYLMKTRKGKYNRNKPKNAKSRSNKRR